MAHWRRRLGDDGEANPDNRETVTLEQVDGVDTRAERRHSLPVSPNVLVLSKRSLVAANERFGGLVCHRLRRVGILVPADALVDVLLSVPVSTANSVPGSTSGVGLGAAAHVKPSAIRCRVPSPSGVSAGVYVAGAFPSPTLAECTSRKDESTRHPERARRCMAENPDPDHEYVTHTPGAFITGATITCDKHVRRLESASEKPMTHAAHTSTSARSAATSRGGAPPILGVCADAIAAVAIAAGRRHAGAARNRTAGGLPA